MSDLSSKPAHQEVDCRDDFDAVDVGRMAPPANDDDFLVTAGDLLERPELKCTQLALASRLLVNRLCNLDVTKGNQLLEVSRFQEPSSHSSLAPICKFFSWDENELAILASFSHVMARSCMLTADHLQPDSNEAAASSRQRN